ncbi:MAG: SDR family oxidoreductase [Leptolyngbyaceae cyanobacterium SM1_3_5]|nr:SDR family oxidoreductase [Leptolyngbyaceae cyanobacterium SM1_3_5]
MPEPRKLKRRILLQGGIGIAGATAAVVAGSAQANNASDERSIAQATLQPSQGGQFANQVVLITGATSGIGEATARAFAEAGAIVHFCGRRENLGNQVADSINSTGGRATYQKADVQNEAEVKALVDECVRRYGRLDVAFNNAGIVNPRFVKLHEQPTQDYIDTLNINALGVFLSMKYEIPQMLAQGSGIIINNSSVSGHKGYTEISPYNASKHAVISLTRVAALEYARDNIRVCSISPGGVDTAMLRYAFAQRQVPFEEAVQTLPIGRANTVEEMAQSVLFLASPQGSAFHGSAVDVTCGLLA